MKKRIAVLFGLIMTMAVVGGCGKETGTTADVEENETPAAVEQDAQTFDSILASLPADAYYAYADMAKDHDALLVTTKDLVFDNGDGVMAATEADVYGIDQDGKVKEYGHVAGGGTATPLACKDGVLFYGGHNYMNKVHIEEATSEMITDEGEYFDEYAEAIVVAFNPSPSASETASEESAYFTKGVYYNYAKDAENPPLTYFYVFYDENTGYTADGENHGVGLPFSVAQEDGKATFSFGGEGESEEVLTVSSFENGIVTGTFDDGREVVFEPVSGLDPETFDAENYVNGPSQSVYKDPNGWSVKYDASLFEVTQEEGQVFFVYTGESAGTNMVTATYTVDNKAEDAIKKLGENYGDTAEYSTAPFPGAEDVDGYWVNVPVDTEGSGAYMTAMARDYMEGALIFEIDGHQGEDDEMNMAVADALAGIIDSLTFE